MALKCKGIFVVGAKRTPFCKHGGFMRDVPASHAFAAAAQDAMRSANVDPNIVDNTVVGNAFFLSQCDGGKTPRYCGIYSRVPIERPALGVNKACGSGLQAVINGAVDILTGLSKVTLTGGTEIMSALPFLVRNVRFGTTLAAKYQFEDILNKEFLDSFCEKTVQRLAEDLAMKHGVSREDCDRYALDSYSKFTAAQESKTFDDEITAVTVTHKKKQVVLDEDDINLKTLEELKSFPSLVEDGSIVTEGNSYAPADGAAAVVLANEETLKIHNLTPLARVSGWACIGTDPHEFGLGAVDAAKRLINDQGLRIEDVDLFETIEAFSSQALLFTKKLDIDPGTVNKNGGAIAMGHPIGATGARMVTHLVHQLRKENLKRGMATASCGGGQGIALLLENV